MTRYLTIKEDEEVINDLVKYFVRYQEEVLGEELGIFEEGPNGDPVEVENPRYDYMSTMSFEKLKDLEDAVSSCENDTGVKLIPRNRENEKPSWPRIPGFKDNYLPFLLPNAYKLEPGKPPLSVDIYEVDFEKLDYEVTNERRFRKWRM